MTPLAAERIRAWGLFLLLFAFIAATLDLAFETSSFLAARGYLWKTVRAMFVVAGAAFAYVVAVGAGIRSPLVWLRTIPALALFFHAAVELRASPGERFHFIEYGVLYLLALRATSLESKPVLAYLRALAATSIAGWVDEVLQGMSDVRVYDPADVRMNIIAAALSMVVCALLFGRGVERARFDGLRLPKRDVVRTARE